MKKQDKNTKNVDANQNVKFGAPKFENEFFSNVELKCNEFKVFRESDK